MPRFPILMAAALLIAGCAAHKTAGSACRMKCETPVFSISLAPHSQTGTADDPIHISEYSYGVVVRTMTSRTETPITDLKLYQRLKRKILTSQAWKIHAIDSSQSPFKSGIWFGPPRDILMVGSGGREMCLQDSKVPRSWKNEIIHLSTGTAEHK